MTGLWWLAWLRAELARWLAWLRAELAVNWGILFSLLFAANRACDLLTSSVRLRVAVFHWFVFPVCARRHDRTVIGIACLRGRPGAVAARRRVLRGPVFAEGDHSQARASVEGNGEG